MRRPDLSHRLLTTVTVVCLSACGAKGCTSCTAPLPAPRTPDELMRPGGIHFRVSQQGFDVIAAHLVAILKALLGATAGGDALIDVSKLLPGTRLAIQGGLGLFGGTASVRDLVLTLDMDSLSVKLVDKSSPARIRIAIDKAKLGVAKGVVAGEASFLGMKSDAACHLHNGLGVGTPDERIATVSATLDVVLGVDDKGALDLRVQVTDPVLHELGWTTSKDCKLAECGDQVLLEDPCLECGICATGKLTSDLVSSVSDFLQPLLGDLLETVAGLLMQQVLASGINGKSLDVELPLAVGPMVRAAAPRLGGWLGEAEPLRVRVRPSPQAFSVLDKALRAVMDGAVFARARACVLDSGDEHTGAFAALPQGPAPALPAGVEAGALVSRAVLEEALWAVLRSGLLCASVDSAGIHKLSGGKLVLVAAALDLALPGLREIVPADAPLRITLTPTASLSALPRTQMSDGGMSDGGAGELRIRAALRGLGIQVQAAMRGRWLTLIELVADAVATLEVGLEGGGRLRVEIVDIAVPSVHVADSALFPDAELQLIVGPLVEVGLSLLLGQPMTFALDLDGLIASVLKLPIHASVVGLQVAGAAADWLLVGIALAGGGGAP